MIDLAALVPGRPFLGSVTTITTLPTAPNVFYGVVPLVVSGTESEGSAVITTTDPFHIYVLILGTTACVSGDQVVYYRVDDRWVAERFANHSGSISVIVPGCPCPSSPETLTMTSSEPASNNEIFQNATLVYGPTPSPLLPVVLTSSSYISTSSFPDPILGVDFYYLLTCSSNSYILTRVYISSPFGSPYRDAVRYKWVPGLPGNTCTPFLMTNGQIFLGGDPSCVVTLSL